jgi:hypothetical protein
MLLRLNIRQARPEVLSKNKILDNSAQLQIHTRCVPFQDLCNASPIIRICKGDSISIKKDETNNYPTCDIFAIKIDDKSQKFMQYVMSDLTQLNSDVIRVFKGDYPQDSTPDISEITKSDVEFYAHCVLKFGLKLGYWIKFGHSIDVGKLNILFRSSADDPRVPVSYDWWIWNVNSPQKHVGRLIGENKNADIGSVIPPQSLLYRMKHRKYDFVYPKFE